MNADEILQKFGSDYIADNDTFRFGINIIFTDHLAKRFAGKTVLETCSGGGFTTISLAKYAKHVYSFEINNKRINDAKNNCLKAGFSNKVTFINKDIYEIECMDDIKKEVEAAFIDPDWNNLQNGYQYHFKNSMTKPASDILLSFILTITKNVTLVQPPYIEKNEFINLPEYEFEELKIGDEKALYCLHFGNLIRTKGNSSFTINQ